MYLNRPHFVHRVRNLASYLQRGIQAACGSHDFLLYLNIPVRYPEPGDYSLTNGGAEVDVREYATGSFWQSVSGVLTTTSSDGRSGTVSTVLEAAAGNNTVLPGATLRVDGPWSCL